MIFSEIKACVSLKVSAVVQPLCSFPDLSNLRNAISKSGKKSTVAVV